MVNSRILIYRLGSLGDTVVALPCFHLIARAFPTAERLVLTNFPVRAKAPALSEVIGSSGLVHSYVEYPVGTRSLQRLLGLARRIRAWGPDTLIYLAVPRSSRSVTRDLFFFRLCGIRRIFGAPTSPQLRKHQQSSSDEELEYEASRLARTLAPLGNALLEDPGSWDLRLSEGERAKAASLLASAGLRPRNFIACSVGTKIEVKDWGLVKWTELLSRLARSHGRLGLLLVGSQDEAAASDRAAANWLGPVLNVCGKISPREAAAAMKPSIGFVGHDSGPMHLAAAAGVPCTAIFSARNIPRVWFPYGEQHRVLYHRTPCAGCQLERCVDFGKQCIESITVKEVHEAATSQIAMSMSSRSPAETR